MSYETQSAEDDSSAKTEDLDKEALFVRLKNWVIEDRKYNSPWYKEASTDYDFEAGKQWEAEEVSALEELKRLHVTFNRVKPTVDVICGMEVTNRQEVQYLPRTTASPLPQIDPATQQPIAPTPGTDDSEATEGYSEVGRWARDNCDAEDEESDAFRDVVTCGMGWTETEMDYETEPDGRIVINRLDPLEMGWDWTSTKRNLDDAKRFHRTRRDIAISDARGMFPGVDDADLHAAWAFDAATDEGSLDHDREKARNYGNNQSRSEERTKVTMVIIQWCETLTKYQVFNPADGGTFEASKEELKQLEKRAKEIGVEITSRPVKRRCWYRATLGNRVLDYDKAPCEHSSTYRPITGYRDRNKRQWYGIVRPMRDPQKWANKFFSVALEQIATSGKGIMAEVGAFVDDKKAEQDWAKTGNIAWLNPGAIAGQKVLPKPQPPLLSGLAELMQLSLTAIRDVTGVNQEAIGLADRDQAASLEYQRRQAAVTILAAFFDNLRRYRKEQGRVLLYFIQNYISDGRIVRILGEQGTPKLLQLIRQPDTIQYDVIVDQAPSSPNQKEAAWMVTQQILPMLMDQGAPPPVMLEFLKASPLPESNVQRIQKAYQKAAEEQSQQGPSLEQQKLQAETQKIQADAQKSQAEGQLKAQELQMRKYEADLNAALTLEQLKGQQAQQAFDMQKSQFDFQATQQQQQFDMAMRQLELQQAGVQQQHDMKMKDQEMQGMQVQQAHDREMGQMKMMGEANKQEHEQKVRTIEATGKTDQEAAKNPGLTQALVQNGKALEAGLEALAQSIALMAKELGKPKTATLSADGTRATIQ